MSNQNQEAQQAREQNRALLRQFIEHTPAPVAILDRNMKYIMTSRRFLTDYNLKPQDLRYAFGPLRFRMDQFFNAPLFLGRWLPFKRKRQIFLSKIKEE